MRKRVEDSLLWLGIFLTSIGLVVLLSLPALAQTQIRWKPEYANNAPEVSLWYREQRLTPESLKKWGFIFCCDNADVCEECVVYRTTATPPWKDGFVYRTANGEWKEVPQHIVEYVPWTPTGKPVLFLFPYNTRDDVPKGTPVCLKVPGGGT